jgi:hypothetical protein
MLMEDMMKSCEKAAELGVAGREEKKNSPRLAGGVNDQAQPQVFCQCEGLKRAQGMAFTQS